MRNSTRMGEYMTDTDDVRVERMPPGSLPLLQELVDEYVTESEHSLPQPAPRDEAGHIAYPNLDRYFTDAQRIPLSIHVEGRLAGFCLLISDPPLWLLPEFFVRPEERRHGVGSRAIEQVVAFCRKQGGHTGIELTTLRTNERARAFWLSQGVVQVAEDDKEYTFQLRFD